MSVAVYSKGDSEVFGYEVATMYVGERDQLSQGKIAEDGGRFDVVFVATKRWLDFPSLISPPALDHLYDMELDGAVRSSDATTILASPSVRHLEIARMGFRDSRFLRDPLLEKKAGDVYVRWVSSARVHVVANDVDSAFLLTKRDVDGAARISLVAVDECRRGLGIGEALVRSVIGKSPGIWKVKVSVRNHRAIRFYEKVGFLVKDAWTAFHVWPKEYRRL